MKIVDLALHQSLLNAQNGRIAPVWFFHIQPKNLDNGSVFPIGVWSGDEDIVINVETPEGGLASRTYYGRANLRIEGITYVADLTDNPVNVSMSHIAPVTELIARGYDLRMAYCEIHATTRTGGALTSTPSLQWIGIVDGAPLSTASVGGEGGITMEIRSELMTQLTAINPAKSSDEHQRRRDPLDGFSRYSGTVGMRNIKWYHEG